MEENNENQTSETDGLDKPKPSSGLGKIVLWASATCPLFRRFGSLLRLIYLYISWFIFDVIKLHLIIRYPVNAIQKLISLIGITNDILDEDDLENQTTTLYRSCSIEALLTNDTSIREADDIYLPSSYGKDLTIHKEGRSFDDSVRHASRANIEMITLSDHSGDTKTEASNDIPEVSCRLHSVESMSAVDGPGLRYLIFLQGCPRRCLFCGNPDSWDYVGGTPSTTKQIAAKIKACSPYLQSNGGGITISGGEPLCQPEAVAVLFRETHALGLTTCLDTTGYGTQREWDMVLPHTDLVLLCLKSFIPDKRYQLTKTSDVAGFDFAEELERRNVKFWLRYVMLPGMTDGQDELDLMEEFITAHTACVGLEVLPFHRLGVDKWTKMGLEFELSDLPTPSKSDIRGVVERFEMLGVKVLCQS